MFFFSAIAVLFANSTAAQVTTSLTAGDQWISNRVTASLPTTQNVAEIVLTNTGTDTLYLTSLGVTPKLLGTGVPDSAKIAQAMSNIYISSPFGWTQITRLQAISGWTVSGTGFGVVNAGGVPYYGQVLAPGAQAFMQISASVAAGADSSGINSILFDIVVNATNNLIDSIATRTSAEIFTHQIFLKRSLSILKKPGTLDQVFTTSNTPSHHTLLGTFDVVNTSPTSIQLSGVSGILQGSIGGNTPTADSIELFDRNGHQVGIGGTYTNGNNAVGNQLWASFNNPYYVNSGDTETFQIFGDLPQMAAGDELSIAASFNGNFQNYYPWGIFQPSYVITDHEAVGQKTIVETSTGIVNEPTLSVIRVVNTGTIASFDAPETFTVNLYDALGQLILNEEAHQTIVLTNLPAGVYEYHVTTGTESRNGKICMRN